jgi:hypothetical protein
MDRSSSSAAGLGRSVLIGSTVAGFRCHCLSGAASSACSHAIVVLAPVASPRGVCRSRRTLHSRRGLESARCPCQYWRRVSRCGSVGVIGVSRGPRRDPALSLSWIAVVAAGTTSLAEALAGIVAVSLLLTVGWSPWWGRGAADGAAGPALSGTQPAACRLRHGVDGWVAVGSPAVASSLESIALHALLSRARRIRRVSPRGRIGRCDATAPRDWLHRRLRSVAVGHQTGHSARINGSRACSRWFYVAGSRPRHGWGRNDIGHPER